MRLGTIGAYYKRDLAGGDILRLDPRHAGPSGRLHSESNLPVEREVRRQRAENASTLCARLSTKLRMLEHRAQPQSQNCPWQAQQSGSTNFNKIQNRDCTSVNDAPKAVLSIAAIGSLRLLFVRHCPRLESSYGKVVSPVGEGGESFHRSRFRFRVEVRTFAPL